MTRTPQALRIRVLSSARGTLDAVWFPTNPSRDQNGGAGVYAARSHRHDVDRNGDDGFGRKRPIAARCGESDIGQRRLSLGRRCLPLGQSLPSVGNIGYRAVGAPATDVRNSEKHDPRVDGAGFRGAIGYIFPSHVLPFVFGSNTRVEIGGSYLKADGTSFANTANFDASVISVNLFGIVTPPALLGCGGSTCTTPPALTSDHRSWDISLTGKSDFRFGAVTLTPSVAVFAGEGRTQHNLAQKLLVDGAPYPAIAGGGNSYDLNAALKWKDRGGKIGLDLNYDVTTWLTFGLGGTAGWASRSASLFASDSLHSPASTLVFTSSVAESARVTTFLTSAEAKVAIHVNSNFQIKGFAGVSRDSKVPGISGIEFPSTGLTSLGPSHIKFESETSYFAGGGLTISFGP